MTFNQVLSPVAVSLKIHISGREQRHRIRWGWSQPPGRRITAIAMWANDEPSSSSRWDKKPLSSWGSSVCDSPTIGLDSISMQIRRKDPPPPPALLLLQVKLSWMPIAQPYANTVLIGYVWAPDVRWLDTVKVWCKYRVHCQDQTFVQGEKRLRQLNSFHIDYMLKWYHWDAQDSVKYP